MWHYPKPKNKGGMLCQIQFQDWSLNFKIFFSYEKSNSYLVLPTYISRISEWGCKLLTVAFTSCYHPWVVSFQTESLWVFHSWAQRHGTARYTKLWMAQFVGCWLTDNKLHHQSKGLPRRHWSTLFAIFLCAEGGCYQTQTAPFPQILPGLVDLLRASIKSTS